MRRSSGPSRRVTACAGGHEQRVACRAPGRAQFRQGSKDSGVLGGKTCHKFALSSRRRRRRPPRLKRSRGARFARPPAGAANESAREPAHRADENKTRTPDRAGQGIVFGLGKPTPDGRRAGRIGDDPRSPARGSSCRSRQCRRPRPRRCGGPGGRRRFGGDEIEVAAGARRCRYAGRAGAFLSSAAPRRPRPRRRPKARGPRLAAGQAGNAFCGSRAPPVLWARPHATRRPPPRKVRP
ncbi:hypothetical protein DFR50_12192 [Roseiarcus fermentans]|uniref:Uncharacterized protein n=1 Tax=Roseiarcus fermentans TaxID=1473586 RepID=A0A366F6H6_9HYPH|nr:hypothetical protein DFR50_12192 [Roseiarcus fermentans]